MKQYRKIEQILHKIRIFSIIVFASSIMLIFSLNELFIYIFAALLSVYSFISCNVILKMLDSETDDKEIIKKILKLGSGLVAMILLAFIIYRLFNLFTQL